MTLVVVISLPIVDGINSYHGRFVFIILQKVAKTEHENNLWHFSRH